MASFLIETAVEVEKGRRFTLSKEGRDPLEGLAFAVLFAVGLVSGILLGQWMQATDTRLSALEARQQAVEERVSSIFEPVQ